MSTDETAATEPTITAEPPESPVGVTGVDHISLIGSNVEDTVEFYRDVLGLSLVLRQPNLDAPNVEHLFFDPGDGRIITFFVEEGRQSDGTPLANQLGSVHHISFSFDPERLEAVKEGLEAHGYGYNEFDRGIFHSLYTRDHNGFVVELSTDKYEIPDGRRGEVLALAQAKRVADGADYAKGEHLKAALEELGLPAEAAALPDRESGAGGLE